MKPEDFIIPVDKYVSEFLHHLSSHPRAILSARYGDGKSYFLSEVINSQKDDPEYIFLTVYPVNYQVIDNKDVFESVKRDILLQLFIKGMIKEEYEISDEQALLFCMQNKAMSLSEVILPFLCDSGIGAAALGVPVPKEAGKILGAGLKVFNQISEAYKEFRKFKKGEDSKVEEFLINIDKLPIYENDVITHIIRDNLNSWKEENPNKKVVLLFEDMDRIDPAHIFRILNVLSAQMDNCYGYAVRPDYSSTQNKFGFDNIVVVLDYNNLKSIFHHFYGVDTKFEGYIEKFSGKGIFEYSLEENLKDYFYEYLEAKTQIGKEFIQEIIPTSQIALTNIRKIVECIDLAERQIIPLGDNFQNAKRNTSLLNLLVIAVRLQGKDIVKDRCLDYFKRNVVMFLRHSIHIISYINRSRGVLLQEGNSLVEYSAFDYDEFGLAYVAKGVSHYVKEVESKSRHAAYVDQIFNLLGR